MRATTDLTPEQNSHLTVDSSCVPGRIPTRPILNRLMLASMAGHVVQTVDAFGELLKELMQRAEEVKQTHTVEPPLNKSDFEDILERVETQFFSSAETLELRKQRHAAIDTAIRDKFNDLLVSTTGAFLGSYSNDT